MSKTRTLNPSYRWVILIINFFVCALAYAGLTTWSTASPELVETFKISNTVASLGSSAFMAGYAVGSFVEANVSAKRGYRAAGLLGLILMTIGILGIPYAPNFGIVLVLRFCQGWGILWLVGVNSTVAWFPPAKRGFASGMIGAALVLGIGCGGLVATGLLNAAGSWQGAFKLFAVILLVATVIWGLLMKNPPKDLYEEPEANAAAVKKSGRKINPYKTVGAWLCALCLFFNCWQLIGFNSLASSYITSLGYTDVQAGLVVLFTGLIGILSTVLSGFISDGMVKKGVLPIKARAVTMAIPGFLVAAVSTVLYPFIAPISFGMAIFGCLLVGWGVPVTNGSLGALPMDLLGDEEAAGKMFGLTIFLGIGAGGILAPYVASSCAESYGYTVALIVLGAGALVATVISLILPKFQLRHDGA